MSSAAPAPRPLPQINLGSCVLANPHLPFTDIVDSGLRCPFHSAKHTRGPSPPPALASIDPAAAPSPTVARGTFVSDDDSARLLASIGGTPRLLDLCTRFYTFAFRDQDVRLFMFLDDGAAAAGERLAKWLGEKMGDAERPWSSTLPTPDRTRTHVSAWHSPHREPHKMGLHFKLSDCRAWMRLMGLALRDTGLTDHIAFTRWFTQFIAHFIAVYERTAPPYAAADFAWSGSARRVDAYTSAEYKFTDLY